MSSDSVDTHFPLWCSSLDNDHNCKDSVYFLLRPGARSSEARPLGMQAVPGIMSTPALGQHGSKIGKFQL